MAIEALTPEFGVAVHGRDHQKDIFKFGFDAAEDLLRAHGAVYFRGFDLATAAFVDFTNSSRFDAYTPYVGGAVVRKLADRDKTVLLASAGESPGEGIELHGEQYYQSDRPDKIMFFCETPAVKGGATTICDGHALGDKLSPPIRALFEARDIAYRMKMEDGTWQKLLSCPDEADVLSLMRARKAKEGERFTFAFDNDKKSLDYRFVTNAFAKARHTGKPAFVNNILSILLSLKSVAPGPNKKLQVWLTFADGEPISPELLSAIQRTARGLTFCIPWRAGDFVLVDNSRVMHGRQEYEGDSRRVIVRQSKYG